MSGHYRQSSKSRQQCAASGTGLHRGNRSISEGFVFAVLASTALEPAQRER